MNRFTSRHPLRTLRVPAITALVAALTVFTACIFSDDKEGGTLKHTYTGKLADLDRIVDTTSLRPQWNLPVDLGDEPVLRGTCDYRGYLGDSARVEGEEAHPELYTNTTMGGTRRAPEFRSTGVILSMDSAQQMDTLTHYRADFNCTY